MKVYNAYNGDTELKQKLITLSIQHREQDQYIRGTFGEENMGADLFKGCSVGCSVVDVCSINQIELDPNYLSDHGWLAEQLGVPVFVTRLQDTFFESVSEARRKTWTTDFFEAIPVGKDLYPILPKFLKIILASVLVHAQDEKYKQQKDSVIKSMAVIDKWIENGEPDKDASDAAWAAARAASWSAARAADAADAAAWAARAAADAAWAAARAADAADAASYAAWAAGAASWAADAAASYAAKTAAFDTYSDKFLKLIKES